MRISAACLTLATSLLSLNAFAACENPSMVLELPDGASASLDEMVAAQAAVKTYMGEMETYLACLNGDIEATGDDAASEFKTLMVTRYNTAVVELETVAAAFNQQLQAYRSANPENE
jgi:hypothetical protein